MAKTWYDPHALRDVNDQDKELYEKILAYRKPYFMRYIYPQLSKDYVTHNKKNNRNAIRKLGISLNELLDKPHNKLSKEETAFINDYYKNLPVGMNGCVMNKICYIFEDRFDSVADRRINVDFDHNVLKSDAEYSSYEYKSVEKLYKEYKEKIKSYTVHLQYEHEDRFDVKNKTVQINEEFLEECASVCPNKYALCNIVLDMAYNTESGKAFAWGMCGDVIIENLMNRYGHKLTFPVINDDGDIHYCGNNYELITVDLEDEFESLDE